MDRKRSCARKCYADTLTSDKAACRRRHDDELKAQVLAECEAPGASMATVVLACGINTSVVQQWRQLACKAGQRIGASKREFMTVMLAPAGSTGNSDARSSRPSCAAMRSRRKCSG